MQKFVTKKNLIIAGIALLVVILLLLAVPACYDSYFSAKVTHGVTMQGISMSGKNEDEISALLDEEIAKPKNVQILVGEKQISLDLNSAGFSIDKEKTMADIQSMGKNNFLAALKIRLFRTPVTVSVVSDEEMFVNVMETLLKKENLQDKRFEYTIHEDRADITLKTDSVSYDTPMLFQMILLDYPKIKDRYEMNTTPGTMPTVAEIKEAINVSVIDAKIEKIDGKIKIVPHQTGLSLDEAVLAEKLNSGETSFSVPITLLKPKVYTDDLSDDAFPNRLATYTTKYNEKEASRTTNVKLAAGKVNGTVLNSGDIFSFNKVVGKRSYENGFRDAKIFLSDKVVEDVGGGICQVSSTIYPAVLYSDLKIVERRNHNFVVAYAKSGIDATVVYGAIDFKFQNSLQNPIKIKAFASNGNMTVEVWGTKENNNTVELSTKQLGYTPRTVKYEYNEALALGEEKVTQGGYDGVKVQAFRTVKDASGNVIRTDNLGVSNYVPLVRIVQTGDQSLAETGVPTETPPPEATPSPSIAPKPAATPTPTPSVSPVPTEIPLPEASAKPSETPLPEATEIPETKPEDTASDATTEAENPSEEID